MVSLILAALVVSHSIAPISLYTLRQQVPEQARPFKLPFYGFICRLVFVLLTLIAYWTGWHTLSTMFLAILAGVVYLFLYRLKQPVNHKPFLNFKKSLWLWVYLAGLALISYTGDKAFSGLGYLSFGTDIILLIIFSLVIFEWSIRECLTSDQAALQIIKEKEVQQDYYNTEADEAMV